MKHRHFVRLILGTLVLIFVQIVALNHVRLFDYFLPIFYLYFFVKMPVRSSAWVLTLLGFCTGLVMDMLMNTPGLNCAAATATLFLRPQLLSLLVDDEDLEEDNGALVPSFVTMPRGRYLLYVLLLTLVHITLIMSLEVFSTRLFVHVIPHILGSTLLSLLVILLLDIIRTTKPRQAA